MSEPKTQPAKPHNAALTVQFTIQYEDRVVTVVKQMPASDFETIPPTWRADTFQRILLQQLTDKVREKAIERFMGPEGRVIDQYLQGGETDG